MYFSNINIEEFDRYVEFLGFNYSDAISEAPYIYIDLEAFIFPEEDLGFHNHNLSSRELIDRFNKILSNFSIFENNNPNQKQYRLLSTNLIDVQSAVNEDLFKWSYFNHKFAASQGQDREAMDNWHKLEQNLDTNEIAQFKARRETNLALYMHVIKNHQFFDEILFGGIDPRIKNEVQFGLDIAEEQYITKLIKEHKASKVCKLVEFHLSSPLLNLLRKFVKIKKFKLNGHIASTSKKLNPYLLLMIRNIFSYLSIQESGIEEADFIFLINDLDMLSMIPIVDTDRPIFTVDLSQISTPNFSYLLLKDDGFEQIYSFAKERSGEKPVQAFIRSICAGLMHFIIKRKFTEQLAINYMDDYFGPLSQSLGKTLKDFEIPISLLTEKLDIKKEKE